MEQFWKKIFDRLDNNRPCHKEKLENPRIPEENILSKGSDTQRNLYWSAVLTGQKRSSVLDPTSGQYSIQMNPDYISTSLDYTKDALDGFRDDFRNVTVWSKEGSNDVFSVNYNVKHLFEILDNFEDEEIKLWRRPSGNHYEKEEFIISEATSPQL